VTDTSDPTTAPQADDAGAAPDAGGPSNTTELATIVELCKRRGIIFPTAEIYGGVRSTWDYGPLGVELKENVKRQWWRTIVQLRDEVVGMEQAILGPS